MSANKPNFYKSQSFSLDESPIGSRNNSSSSSGITIHSADINRAMARKMSYDFPSTLLSMKTPPKKPPKIQRQYSSGYHEPLKYDSAFADMYTPEPDYRSGASTPRPQEYNSPSAKTRLSWTWTIFIIFLALAIVSLLSYLAYQFFFVTKDIKEDIDEKLEEE